MKKEMAESVRESADNSCCFRRLSNGARRVILEVTRKCNLHCAHCMVPMDEAEPSAFSPERLKRLMYELPENGISKVMITGGEPLLVPDIVSCIRIASEQNILVDLNSNLTLIDKKMARSLREAGLKEVTTSIDGTRETHCQIRGDLGCYDKTLRAIGYLLEEGISVDVVCTVMQQNCNELEDVARTACQVGVSSLTYSGLIPDGRARDKKYSVDYAKIRETIDRIRSESTIPIRTVRMYNFDYSNCHKGIDMVGIDYKGFVHPCLQDKMSDALNLNEHTLAECISYIDSHNNHICSCNTDANKREYRFLCRVLKIQKHKNTSFLYVEGFEKANQLLIDTKMLVQENIGPLSILRGYCRETNNKNNQTVYTISVIEKHARSNCFGIDISKYSNKELAVKRCRYAIINKIEEYLKENGFQKINSPFTMKYRGTSTSNPLKIQGKHINRYCKITHELQLKQACSELLMPTYEIGYVTNDIYTTQTKWFEFTILELVSPLHQISFISDLIQYIAQVSAEIADAYGVPHEDFRNLEIITLEENDQMEEQFQALKNTDRNILFVNAPTNSPLVKQDGKYKTETVWYFKGVKMGHGYVDENDCRIFESICEEQMKTLTAKNVYSEYSHDFIKLLRIGIPESISLGLGLDRIFMALFQFDTIKSYISSCMGYYE